MTYMGIGESDLSVHFSQTQTDDVSSSAEDLTAALEADENVERYTVLSGMVFSNIVN